MGRKYNNKKLQEGGIISQLFSGFQNSLEGFKDEPGFENALSDSSFKSIFDIFSILGQGSLGGFKDGGEVDEHVNNINNTLSEFNYESKKQLQKDIFNAKHGEGEIVDSFNIVPNYTLTPLPDFRKGSYVKGSKNAESKINSLLTKYNNRNNDISSLLKRRSTPSLQGGGIAVSPFGQFEFPGQPVAVPTEDGKITMDGVDTDILAIDEKGVRKILPSNSGTHQFNPGLVLEIPIPPEIKKKRRKKKKKMNLEISNLPEGKKEKDISTTFAARTSKRFNDRNRRTTNKNKAYNKGLPFVNR